MSLSVCLLTRNDESNVERVLDSVAGLADEIVLGDTGSTDRTVDLATVKGANLFHVAWDDDFASGRNQVLCRAQGDWILWLNPDEELDKNEHPQLRSAIKDESVFAFILTVQEYSKRDQTSDCIELSSLRLFRRDPEVKFLGRLHPEFAVPLPQLAEKKHQEIGFSRVVIHHHAYLSSLTEEKLRWTLRLLERELADRPGQLAYLIEWGDTLQRLNDPKSHSKFEEAITLLNNEKNNARPSSPKAQRLLEYILRTPAVTYRGIISKLEAVELSFRWFPNSPPLLWILANQSFTSGDFFRASQILEALVALGKNKTYDRSLPFDPSIVGDFAAMNLAACYVQGKEWNKAEESYRSLLNSPQVHAQAARNLAKILDNRGLPGADGSPVN